MPLLTTIACHWGYSETERATGYKDRNKQAYTKTIAAFLPHFRPKLFVCLVIKVTSSWLSLSISNTQTANSQWSDLVLSNYKTFTDISVVKTDNHLWTAFSACTVHLPKESAHTINVNMVLTYSIAFYILEERGNPCIAADPVGVQIPTKNLVVGSSVTQTPQNITEINLILAKSTPWAVSKLIKCSKLLGRRSFALELAGV